MADTEQQEAQQAEDATETTVDAQQATENEDSQGKGSKAAVLADLAAERDKRQAAETAAQETAAKLEQVLTALGLKTDEGTPDPEQLAADLKAKDAELAVLRAGTGIADVDALLDSRAFTQTLSTIDPSDREAVKAHIQEYVTANPRFAVTPQAQGVRDAAAGADSTTASASVNDLIRAAAGR